MLLLQTLINKALILLNYVLHTAIWFTIFGLPSFYKASKFVLTITTKQRMIQC